MAETVQLAVQPRGEHGTRAARRLRKGGQVPGVVYGHKEATVSITVPGDALAKAIRVGTRIFDLQVDGKTETTLIKDVQWDPLGHAILHVDFTRISKDERVEVPVSLVLRGIAPGVTGGGVLDQPLHELTIECLATAIPDSIRVNIGNLQKGDVIHVRDLTIPEGVVVKDEPDAVVVQVVEPAGEEEPTAGPAGEMAEPEVIGKPKEEEETE
jgi:large subunit ribosomal protein L25